MEWTKRQQSRLGQILLARRLISQEQLDQAIREQGRTGQRLGEVLAAMQLITQAQVKRAMRRQRNLRLAAALATSLLAPLQAYAALAAAPVAVAVAGVRTQRELSDEELGEVAGQGRTDEDLRARLREQALRAQLQMATLAVTGAPAQSPASGRGQALPGELAKLFMPLAGLLNAEVSVSDVAYDPEQSSAVVNKDGSVTLRLPTTIGEIKLRNIRVGQATTGPSFGSIALHDIDLRGTTITVTPRTTR